MMSLGEVCRRRPQSHHSHHKSSGPNFWVQTVTLAVIIVVGLTTLAYHLHRKPKTTKAFTHYLKHTATATELNSLMPRTELKGAFWPAVRQRMYEKAVELYMYDHPETQNKPELEELQEGGYLHTAKVLVLREIRLENQPKNP